MLEINGYPVPDMKQGYKHEVFTAIAPLVSFDLTCFKNFVLLSA